MLQPWSNCGYEAEARKAVRESFHDDSWATCLLGHDQSPRLPRKGLASVVLYAADGDWKPAVEGGNQADHGSGNGCAQKETVT